MDTVAFDVDQLEIRLVWRGHVAVEDAAASEIDAIFLLTERTGDTPMTIDDARQKLQP